MKQPTNSNNSSLSQLANELQQMLNKRETSRIVTRYYEQALDEHVFAGLMTMTERANCLSKASLFRDYLFDEFVVARHELVDVPFAYIPDDELLNDLKSGSHNYEELKKINAERKEIVEGEHYHYGMMGEDNSRMWERRLEREEIRFISSFGE